MPFSYDRSLVSAFLQELWEGLLAAVETVLVFHEPIQFKALKLFALEQMYDFCFYTFQFVRPFFRITTSRI